MKNLSLILLLMPALLSARFSTDTEDKLKKAEYYFRCCEYRKALPYYLDIADHLKDDKFLLYKTGICFLHSDRKTSAIPYFETAARLDREKELTDIPFYLGSAFHVNGEFEKAIRQFELYKKALDPTYPQDAEEIEEANRLIRISRNALVLTSTPLKYKIEKLKPPVNSAFGEYSPVLAQDGRTLFFASTRNGCVGGLHPLTGNYNEDIYMAEVSDDGTFHIRNLGKIINTSENEAPLAITGDGKMLFFYRSSSGFASDIYYSEMTPEGWSYGIPLGPNINAKDFKTGGYLRADGKRLYFSSDRPGGFGGMDIYYSDRQDNGEWGPAVNLGRQINTSHNEEAPFLHNNKLYFTSEGHTTIGGFDIFYSVFRDNSWSDPVNIGYPINTPDDDLYISFTPDGNTAYFSRQCEKNYGMEDLYVVHFDELIREEQELRQNTITASLQETTVPVSDAHTFRIDEKKNALNIAIYFPFGVGNSISYYSQSKLYELAGYLKENPSLTLELRGYTDPIGTDEYNQTLSRQRAETVKQYLVERGIAGERLTVKACGSTGSKKIKSIRQNSVNRRVEFYVSR